MFFLRLPRPLYLVEHQRAGAANLQSEFIHSAISTLDAANQILQASDEGFVLRFVVRGSRRKRETDDFTAVGCSTNLSMEFGWLP